MGEASRAIEFVDAAVADARAHGVVHLNAQDFRLDGRSIRIDARERLNFASCSYLGLELDPRLKAGAIDAVERYGTQFSSSRTYVSAPPYEELEALLDGIFEAHTLVTPSTTLSHFSALPVLVGEEDAVILDHQVHQSVQMAIPQIRLQGTHVEFVRHGRLDLLESRISELAESHRKVWYLADGIYSMYGDPAPLKALSWLLARHEQLQLYIDDAHGMSWCGVRGRGFSAEQLAGHERVTIAVSLNKAFGAAGGALVFPNADLRSKVRACGGPMIFGGPVQPPMLGAALASARIHLSPEIEALQQDLLERIRYTNRVAAELDLPLVSRSEVPIRYVGLGLLAACYDMTEHLLERGVFVNPAAFPAVGTRYSGIRFTLTRHQSLEDIRHVLEMIAERLPISLASAGTSREEIDRTFKLEPSGRPRRALRRTPAAQLSCRRENTIRALDANEWNACLGGRGTFDAASLAVLEAAFGPEQPPENRWKFHYYVVRDGGG